MTATNGTLAHAVAYAQRGLHVIPLYTVRDGQCSCGRPGCLHPGKHPRGGRGLHAASTDSAAISEWFDTWPDSNIGIACARSGWLVIDVDPRHRGDQTFAALAQELGKLPPTLSAKTGGGGQHFVFRHPSGVKIRGSLGEGVDVKSNGYIVVEPSRTFAAYTWTTALDHPVANLPARWLERVARTTSQATTRRPGARMAERAGQPIHEGERNTTLHRMGSSMRRTGFSGTGISAALLAENEQVCEPPLGRQEVLDIATSASNYLPPWFTNAPAFFDDPRLGSAARHVLRVLVGHARHDGRVTIDYATIQAETGLGKTTVAKALKELVGFKRITRGRHAFHANEYLIKPFSPRIAVNSLAGPALTGSNGSPREQERVSAGAAA